jgi:hypothetical protein
MGRRKKQIDSSTLLQLRSEGKSVKMISSHFEVSTATLSRRIAELEHNEGILTKYRALQGLQLTSLQFRLLESVSPERIATASLAELLSCFHVLKKSELAIQGKGVVKISGLVQYLVELEKREVAKSGQCDS